MYGSCFLSDCTPPFNVHIHFNNNDDSTKDAARDDGIKNAKQSRLGPQEIRFSRLYTMYADSTLLDICHFCSEGSKRTKIMAGEMSQFLITVPTIDGAWPFFGDLLLLL